MQRCQLLLRRRLRVWRSTMKRPSSIMSAQARLRRCGREELCTLHLPGKHLRTSMQFITDRKLSLFLMNLFMTFATYTQNVYEPYATSYFKGHSLIATFNIIHGLVRIVGYPLLAKTADVSRTLLPRKIRAQLTRNVISISADHSVSPSLLYCSPSQTCSTHPVTKLKSSS